MIYVNEVPVATGHIRTDALLAAGSARDLLVYGLKGDETVNPASRQPACWIAMTVLSLASIALLILYLKS